jgi:hypothetical protein
LPNTSYLDIRFGAVAANAQTALGGAVRCDVIASGAIVSSGYYASVTAALTAVTTLVESYTMVG